MTFFEIDGVPLRVVQDSGVKVDSEINIKSTPLHSDLQKKAYVHFYNAGYNGKTFSVDIIVNTSDTEGTMKVKDQLDKWLTEGSTHIIVTEAIDVTNGEYLITSCKSEQKFRNEAIWSLDFQQYYAKDAVNDTSLVNKGNNDTTNNNTSSIILSKCDLPLTPASPKSTCVEALQQKLKNAGYYLFKDGATLPVDGIYDENVVLAVTLLQRDFQYEYGLNVTGLFDNNTRDCLLNLT